MTASTSIAAATRIPALPTRRSTRARSTRWFARIRVTGKKALYVNRIFTTHIVGVPRDESDAVLAYLFRHAENPLFQCRFRWSENAIAFWDNRCAQHRAMWDYWPHTRSGNRVTIKGERPV